MRRNTLSLLKFVFLCIATIAVTAILFRSFHATEQVDDDNGPDLPKAEGLFAQLADGAKFMGQKKAVARRKIDWHDYNYIEYEKSRVGIGEHGEPAFLSPEEEDERKRLFAENGFNALLSDKIALNRSLADIRHKDCAKKLYLSELPTVSVVVPFYNEHFSTLLRTCYSVLNRSPKHLIKEIILVDDYSSKEFLKDELDQYVAKHLPKVKIVRLPTRSGLIVARLAGARIATAEVLLFLDSHTEANTNWLPPLLEPIAENYRVCVCPFIDVVTFDNFRYRAQDEGARGAFDWHFYYKRLPLLPEDLKDPTKPFRSPVMAGGLFAISTKFFWEIGGYDDGLDIWGGEQYELSFKIWQCHGEMVDAPCSRVGHIYRGGSLPSTHGRKTDFLHKNYKRVAEVWMDEYKQYLYMRSPRIYPIVDAGDLTKQIAIREKLHCKSFKWFMEEVAFDLPRKYPMIEPPDFAWGTIRSMSDARLCVDTLGHGNNEAVGMYPCDENDSSPRSTQFFVLSWHKDIRIKDTVKCWDVATSIANAPVMFYDCHGSQGNQLWHYDTENHWLVQGKNGRCLDCNPFTRELFVNTCDRNNKNMQWKFGAFNKTALENFDKIGFNERDM